MLRDEKGLTPLIGVIIILTLTMAVGAVIAATVSGSPRPTLPMSTALHATDTSFQNLEAGDTSVALSNEWGQQLSDAVKITGTTTNPDAPPAEVSVIKSVNLYWGINGERLNMLGKVISGGEQVSTAGPHDLEPGDMIAGALASGTDASTIETLEHGDLFFAGWEPRQVPLIEMQIQ